MSGLDSGRLDALLGAAVRRGELTDDEAREEWLAAEEEAAMELHERWSR